MPPTVVQVMVVIVRTISVHRIAFGRFMSVGGGILERMFDPVRSSLLDTFGGATDADVVTSIGAAAREENAACARRLEAMGELYARRAPEDDDEVLGGR